jgi:CheY-like chemotaxis protein/predicted regulator of Ras-like GTPase activity (Roadblock/LC7/MglB family)
MEPHHDAPEETHERSGAPCVLVIHDSVSLRAALEEILRSRPLEIRAVATGMDGIGAMLEEPPAAVFCDATLPDRDGLSIARFVRNHPLLRSVPFYLVEGTAGAPDDAAARQSGCTAVLRRPLAADEVLAALDRLAEGADAPPSTPQAPPAQVPARILVVDDSMSVRVALERLLLQRGYETSAASSSAEALRRLGHGGSFDLLISDVVMPDMDGIELVRFVRGLPALRSLPVILVSGIGDADVDERALRAGVEDVVRKPFTGASLLPIVERALARARKEPSTPASAAVEPESRAALRVVAQLAAVAGAEGALLLDRVTGRVTASQGFDEERSRDAAAHAARLVPLMEEAGKDLALRGLRSAILQYGEGFLLLYEAGPFTIVVALSDAGQLGLLNLLVQKKLPRILAGGE